MAEINIAFGRFTLKESLGRGSFGEVFRAYDPDLKQDVALKVLHQGLMADLNFVAKARKEASLVQQIQHPNVVKIFEINEIDGRAYIEMEFIDGRPLADILKSGQRYNNQQIVSFIEQISSALEATHKQKIIHRDVKPANILIDKSGVPHLVDFGLAHAAKSSLGSSSSVAGLGTAMYMSPEQAMGRSGDKTSDVYSLGIVAFELFTGRPPFQADNLPGYMEAHLRQKPPDPRKMNPGVTREIQAVLYKVLSKDPGSRYKSCVDFAIALKKANEKPDSGQPKFLGCAAGAFVLIVIAAVAAWAILAGPLKDQTQKLVDSFSPTDRYRTVLSTATSTEPTTQQAPTRPSPSATAQPPAQPQAAPTQAPQATIAQPAAPNPTNTNPPAPTQPLPTSTSAPAAPGGEPPVLVGTGVRVETVAYQGKGLVVRFMNGVGEPLVGSYVHIYNQKQDLAGKWVSDNEVARDSTDKTGQISFDVGPGSYIVAADFSGYNWGTAADRNGQASVTVEAGKTTQLTLTLARLTIGFLRGDGSVITNQYVQLFRQKQDLAGNWVAADQVSYGRTDNAGILFFDLTPGYYLVASDFAGYSWGNLPNPKGQSSVALQSGQENKLVVRIGQLQVGLKDNGGNPISNEYIQVCVQKQDVNGGVVPGDQVASGRTDNTGIFFADLAPGLYSIKIKDTWTNNIEIDAGKVTFTDGVQTQIK